MDLPTVDLKQTVNLPKTAFSMKANLPQTEPKTLARWESEDLYHAIRASAPGRPVYVLHDGPPYANGRIHLGTAFNKILKDFIVKSKTMAGFDSPYVPGWDCHGLPIEIKVDSELGAKKAHMPALEIRRACRKYAEKYIDLQRQDFKRLGVLGRWEDPYLTMSAAVPVGDRRRVRRLPGPRLRLQGPQAGPLVHQGPHRPGRSRSRIREPHQPVHLGALRAHLRPRAPSTRTSPAAKSTASSGPPPPGPSRPTWPSPSTPSTNTSRSRSAGEVYIVAAELLAGHAQKSAAGSDYQVVATLPRRAPRTRHLPPSLPRARFARHPGRPRHPRTGHRRRPHRPRPRPGGLRHRPAVRHRNLLPGGCRRPLLPRRRRCRPPARRTSSARPSGKPTPSSSRSSKRAGALLRTEDARALLPALLALPPPDHLPRHRAVVHRHGPQRLPPATRWRPSSASSGCPPGAKSASPT